jgi:uncharacterized membrane protein
MPEDTTLTLFVGRYEDVGAALEDYRLVVEDRNERAATTFDAAVVERADRGVRILKKHEVPVRMGAWTGLLAGAALSMVFPAVLLTLPVTAGLGAVIGHFWRGMSRSDLKDIGELLDECDAALVVVVATSGAAEVAKRMGRALTVMSREIAASARSIDSALDEASHPAHGAP